MDSPYGTFSFLKMDFNAETWTSPPPIFAAGKNHTSPVHQPTAQARYFRAVVVVSTIFVSPFAGTSTSQKTSPESFSSVKPGVVAGMRS